MPLALENVVKQLTDSGIIAPGKLENFVPPKAHPSSAEELIAELVKQNQLTRFQAQAVAAGKVKSLILGEYTLLDRIGAGGMGQVFKAEHRRMKRIVAIKMLPPAMTKDGPALARFQREVEAAAKLEHPNIVHANDAGQAGNVHFLVMQYVDGSDLSALVKKSGPLPVDKAVNYILQAARGLEFAHGEGVIHRDIKPANLLLDKKGVVKILDMGLARISTDGNAATQAELTGTGAVMGTVDYMAPEQAMSTKHADARADIYSLGCSLYYLLVSGPVYDGETITAKLVAHQFTPIPSLDSVPEAVEAIFQKMVAKKLEDRYQTMTEVIADFQALLPSPLAGEGPGVRGFESSGTSNSKLTFIRDATLQTRKAKPAQPEKVASGGFKNKKFALIGAGVVAVIVLLAAIVVSLRTKDGTLIVEVDQPGPVPPLAKAPFDAKQARDHQEAWAKHLGIEVETPNSVGMKMVLIPPGEFLMGSTDEQVAAALKVAEQVKAEASTKDRIRILERPQHKVAITKPFLMAATEVTVAQFKKFSATGFQTEAEKPQEKSEPIKTFFRTGNSVSDDSPAACISWNDAAAYCNWLSEQEKATYRLPTEAEWEYACRAGTLDQYSFGDDHTQLEQYAWYYTNAGGRSHPVGTRMSNQFGLFDMQGNLLEWTQDFNDNNRYETSPLENPHGPASGTERILRGGHFNHNVIHCRSAYRSRPSPSSRSDNIGFRIARELDAPSTTASITQPTVPAAAPTKPITDFNTPEFLAWVKEVQAMPAQEQIEAVSKKLVDLNQGFDGKLTIAGVDQPLILNPHHLVDLSPLRALKGIKRLRFTPANNSQPRSKLSDLSPLRGFPLNTFICTSTNVTDLSPLTGMALTSITLSNTDFSDLSPLVGMPLVSASFFHSHVSDLSCLDSCKSLKTLDVRRTRVTAASVAALQKALPACVIEWDDPAKATTPQPAASGTK